ncbi:ABC transporter ATP-binding protein [Namhaeicola litoreus]|uniref:ABC transporter ATP-binding protein n=1 Tax=Namhaeicola litoreus TaxID=1052145 RepID=A0ABW3Y2L4_9FLAO
MLQVKELTYAYQAKKPVLRNVNFNLGKGEHLCVMGESGCGKSTLLKAVYGLLDLDKGTVFWGDQQVLGPAYHLIPGMDFFKYVAQDFELMPFTSVADNIAKFLPRYHPEKTKKRTKELLEVIEMTSFADVKVKNLSGGQQQRVAIARALAKEPELLLLDEPFGQIDNLKKNSLRRILFSFLKEKNISCIVATHDSDDALSFADKMIVLKDGKIVAEGTPQSLYNKPKSNYVGTFFDDINEIKINGKKVLLFPHQIKIVGNSALKATVLKNYFKGFYWLIEMDFQNQKIFVNSNQSIKIGVTVSLHVE